MPTNHIPPTNHEQSWLSLRLLELMLGVLLLLLLHTGGAATPSLVDL
jgi:hypothetical protein